MHWDRRVMMHEEQKSAVERALEISRLHGEALRKANHGHSIGLVDMRRLLVRLQLVHRFDPDLEMIANHVSA